MLSDERINALIKTLRESGKVRMPSWQTEGERIACNLEEFHACGNLACVGGHLALMPEFHADGGYTVPESGGPFFNGYFGAMAVTEWLYRGEGTEWRYRKVKTIIEGQFAGQVIEGWYAWRAEQAIKALEILRDEPTLYPVEFAQRLRELAPAQSE